jgi:hypothetical protein
MRRIEETKGHVQGRLIRKVIGVVVKVAIGFGLYNVSGAHRVPVFG